MLTDIEGGTKIGYRSLSKLFGHNEQPTQRDMIWLTTCLLVSAAAVFAIVAGNQEEKCAVVSIRCTLSNLIFFLPTGYNVDVNRSRRQN